MGVESSAYNELHNAPWWPQLTTEAQEAIRRQITLTILQERRRCCSIVFGQCGSDNVAQRTVNAIMGELP